MTYKPRWLPQQLNKANKSTVKRDPIYYFTTQNRVFIKQQADLLKGYFVFTSAGHKLVKLKRVRKCVRF